MGRPIPAMLAAVVAGIVLHPHPAGACGLDGAGGIGIAVQRAVINWRYPETRRIPANVAEATLAGLLETPLQRAADPLAFHRATLELNRFAQGLAGGARSAATAFTILYTGPMLWTVVEAAGEHSKVKLHAAGPAPGSPLLVTEQSVIRALVSGRISGETAMARGLVTLHASPEQLPALQLALATGFRATAGGPTDQPGH